MYAYNAYALSICGKRAELLHRKMFEEYFNDENQEKMDDILMKYVIGSRWLSMISNGVCLGFYLTIPLGCFILSKKFQPYDGWLFQTAPIICMIIFYIIIITIIVMLTRDFFAIDKIQQGKYNML
jgi:hypothetical protein